MDRIQAAIAKARESRQSSGETQDARPRHSRPDKPRQALRTKAWDDLPTVDLDPGHLSRNRIIARDGGSKATPIDVMRTRTVQQMRPKGWTRLAVTSPDAACGKTMVAINLALSLVRQPETSVVLFDTDLRRPGIAQTLGLDLRHSTADVLAGRGEIRENAVRIGDNLMVMSSRAPAKNPSDLLQGSAVGQVVAEIESTYAPTVMIFDLPPLLVNDDAMAFLGHSQCALLVAAAGQSSVKEIDSCERELSSHTEILGIVLNKCRYMNNDESYGY